MASDSEVSMSSTESKPRTGHVYEEPLVIDSLEEHKQSWIVLHGRGDHAQNFALGVMGFLGIALPDGRGLQDHLPNVRFIFPTAKPRRARSFGRSMITQWFDVYSFSSTEHADRQVEGLRESSEWIHELMRREIEAVGAQNVVLGGLSQGCATSLISLLLWQGEPIKAVFGMSGWLPFKHLLDLAIDSGSKDPGEDVFDRGETEVAEMDASRHNPFGAAIKLLCQELEISRSEIAALKTIPIFITHGGRDYTVEINLGREASECLCNLGYNARFQEYPTLIHWMDGDELQDVVDFVAACGESSPAESGDRNT